MLWAPHSASRARCRSSAFASTTGASSTRPSFARPSFTRGGGERAAGGDGLRALLGAWLCALLCGCSSDTSGELGPGGSASGAGAGGQSPSVTGGAGGTEADGRAGASGGGVAAAGGGGAPAAGASGGAGGTTSGDDLTEALYAPDQFPRFDIDLSEASLAALAAVTSAQDPAQDTYVSASLTYLDQTVTNIGLRIKGEFSFQGLDRKPAFKLKFDEFVPDQSFLGLRRLTLNNAYEDPSFVAERLAYDVFRAAGLPAPRCNNATVYVNGVYYGVYVNIEPEDKTFLRRWFASDEGNLYEEGQVDLAPGAETVFNLETNEELNDRSDLVALIASIEAASDATFLDDMGEHLDTAQFLKFTAAEAAVNQWDMYAYTLFTVNNLRLYSDPTSGKFAFIPWGMDMSMKPYAGPFIPLFELAHRGDDADQPISSGIIFQRCLASGPCRDAYADAAREIVAVYEGLDLEQRALDYHDQILEQVRLDTRKNICCEEDDTLTNEAFEASFQSVLATVRGRVAALQADLDALDAP